jgi:hypothetical protein
MRQAYRVWVNQPSTLQPDHNIHGALGIALEDPNVHPDCVDVYWVKGEAICSRMLRASLSRGWPEHLRAEKENETLKERLRGYGEEI